MFDFILSSDLFKIINNLKQYFYPKHLFFTDFVLFSNWIHFDYCFLQNHFVIFYKFVKFLSNRENLLNKLLHKRRKNCLK